jgi:signal transduction histidine kinase
MKDTQSLIDQIHLMVRIHAALSASIKSDDLFVLVLATLTAPSGLDYQRAMLFLYEPQAQRLRGHLAMGPSNAEEAEERIAEFEAEKQALNHIAAQFHEEDMSPEERDLARSLSLSQLQNSSYWIGQLQQFTPDTELTRLIRQVEHVDPRGPGEIPAGEKPRLIDFIHRDEALVVGRDDIAFSRTMAGIVGEEVVIVPLRTSKGPYGLIVADCRFAPDEHIGAEKLEQLGWYVPQTSLALENAELFSSLQRAFDDLREVDKIKSNFLSTISHELRTPLTAINGFIDLLIGGRVGEVTTTQADLLRRVRLQAMHLTNIVNDLIEVAEVRMGGVMDIDLETVDPLNSLMHVLPKLEPRLRGKKITIEPVPAPTTPMIRCNGRALERIYYHLLDNAVKFIESEGEIQVIFRPDDKMVHIDIRDSGIGIQPDHLKRIFDNFYQVNSNLNRDRNGLGLGLTITKMLLDATEGTIHVESTPGVGSTFTLSFRTAS